MSTKTLIIIIAAVFLLMAMMGGGFFFLWYKMTVTVAQLQNPDAQQEEAAEEEVEEKGMGPLYKLDPMIVNLADHGGKRYLRVTMELELSVPELLEEIEQRLPQLRDSVLMILPAKQYADISTTHGKVALRDEIINSINSFLTKGTINNIYFTEFVIQ